MGSFSCRYKLIPEGNFNSISDVLRKRIFGIYQKFFVEKKNNVFDDSKERSEANIECLLGQLGVNYVLDDESPSAFRQNVEILRTFLNTESWNRILDFVEIMLKENPSDSLLRDLNTAFKEELSPYRIADSKVVSITNEEEINEISAALKLPEKFNAVSQSLSAALGAFSKRPDPDYNSAIVNAITAVESTAKIVVGNDTATLGKCVDELVGQRKMNVEFGDGVKKIYHWTCNEPGKRHGGSKYVSSDEATARFTIIFCSLLTNYLIYKNP